MLRLIFFPERAKVDEEAEHYCAIHSPPRRRRMVMDKVQTGREKINSLKEIEKKKDSQVSLQRSASLRTRDSTQFSKTANQRQKMTKEKNDSGEESLGKKVTFQGHKKVTESKKESLTNVTTAQSPSMPRRSATLPRFDLV